MVTDGPVRLVDAVIADIDDIPRDPRRTPESRVHDPARATRLHDDGKRSHGSRYSGPGSRWTRRILGGVVAGLQFSSECHVLLLFWHHLGSASSGRTLSHLFRTEPYTHSLLDVHSQRRVSTPNLSSHSPADERQRIFLRELAAQ